MARFKPRAPWQPSGRGHRRAARAGRFPGSSGRGAVYQYLQMGADAPMTERGITGLWIFVAVIVFGAIVTLFVVGR